MLQLIGKSIFTILRSKMYLSKHVILFVLSNLLVAHNIAMKGITGVVSNSIEMPLRKQITMS